MYQLHKWSTQQQIPHKLSAKNLMPLHIKHFHTSHLCALQKNATTGRHNSSIQVFQYSRWVVTGSYQKTPSHFINVTEKGTSKVVRRTMLLTTHFLISAHTERRTMRNRYPELVRQPKISGLFRHMFTSSNTFQNQIEPYLLKTCVELIYLM